MTSLLIPVQNQTSPSSLMVAPVASLISLFPRKQLKRNLLNRTRQTTFFVNFAQMEKAKMFWSNITIGFTSPWMILSANTRNIHKTIHDSKDGVYSEFQSSRRTLDDRNWFLSKLLLVLLHKIAPTRHRGEKHVCMHKYFGTIQVLASAP